jgi:hypothetical protein
MGIGDRVASCGAVSELAVRTGSLREQLPSYGCKATESTPENVQGEFQSPVGLARVFGMGIGDRVASCGAVSELAVRAGSLWKQLWPYPACRGGDHCQDPIKRQPTGHETCPFLARQTHPDHTNTRRAHSKRTAPLINRGISVEGCVCLFLAFCPQCCPDLEQTPKRSC